MRQSWITLLRGGGDLASGVALRLHRCGLRVMIVELPQPLVVRRLAAFGEAVYTGEMAVEGVVARRADDASQALALLDQGIIPVLIDPELAVMEALRCRSGAPQVGVLVDGRMRKSPPEVGLEAAPLVIGLGPGFVAGENCHAVIETNRGHLMGRVIWQGKPEADTGVPESVHRYGAERVLRAPADGVLHNLATICDHVEPGQAVAEVGGEWVRPAFAGTLRGLIHEGLWVQHGQKIGDVDPRDDPRYCRLVSDKALAVGGGVLEAILSRADLRPGLWD